MSETTTTETPITEETPVVDPVLPEAVVEPEVIKYYEAKLNDGEWVEVFQHLIDFDGIRVCFKGKTVTELQTMLKDLNNITVSIREMPTDIIVRTEFNLYPKDIVLDLTTNSAMVEFKKLSQEAISALTVKAISEKAASDVEYLAMMMEVDL